MPDPKPKFLLMARRWGWFVAAIIWLKCRRGHEWCTTNDFYLLGQYGKTSHFSAKITCARCGAAKLTDLYLQRDSNGVLHYRSPEFNIVLTD